jgi:ribose transport system ATP-binding protein
VTRIFVSHRLSEMFRHCDAVSVMRDGQHVATRPIEDLTEPVGAISEAE